MGDPTHHGTTAGVLRFPTRRRVVGTAARATLAGAGLALAGLPVAAQAGATGANHSSAVVWAADPTAPGGSRPARVAFSSPAHLGNAAVPVLYFLHGLPGTGGDLETSGVATALFAAMAARGQDLVLVTPAGSSMHAGPRQDTEWGNDVHGAWVLETWVSANLRTAVEGRGTRAARDRIIGGFSMGGFGAAMIGLRHAPVYGSIAAFAGYFHLDDPDDVFGTSPHARIFHRPDHLVWPGCRQRFLLADGDDDTLALTRNETARFAAVVRSKGVSPTVAYAAEGHSLAMVTALAPTLAAFIATR